MIKTKLCLCANNAGAFLLPQLNKSYKNPTKTYAIKTSSFMERIECVPNAPIPFPDLLVLYESTWAALEGKKSAAASHRPNQDYYVREMNDMSFAAFIYPENKEEILNAMERSFEAHRAARLPRSE